MKNFRAIIIVLMLFVFPALSWYYLNTGMEYRKEAYDALLTKGPIGNNIDLNSFSLGDNTFEGKTSLLAFRSDNVHDEQIKLVYEQFKDVDNFQVILINNAGTAPYSVTDGQFILNKEGTFSGKPRILLIDNKGEFRNEYTMAEGDLKSLVAHTALTIPPKKSRDIKVLKTENK